MTSSIERFEKNTVAVLAGVVAAGATYFGAHVLLTRGGESNMNQLKACTEAIADPIPHAEAIVSSCGEDKYIPTFTAVTGATAATDTHGTALVYSYIAPKDTAAFFVKNAPQAEAWDARDRSIENGVAFTLAGLVGIAAGVSWRKRRPIGLSSSKSDTESLNKSLTKTK